MKGAGLGARLTPGCASGGASQMRKDVGCLFDGYKQKDTRRLFSFLVCDVTPIVRAAEGGPQPRAF